MFDCLLFSEYAFLKWWTYARSVTTEICGIGRIERDQFDIPFVSDIAILPQVVGGADANVTAADMEAFFGSIENEEERKEWCFNWHTHPTFATNPSATDLNNYKTLSELFEVLVPMIVNNKGEYNGWVYHSHPVKHTMELKNIWIYEWREHYASIGKTYDTSNQVRFILDLMKITGTGLTQEDAEAIKEDVAGKCRARAVPQHGGYGGASQTYNLTTRQWERTPGWANTNPNGNANLTSAYNKENGGQSVESASPFQHSNPNWTNGQNTPSSQDTTQDGEFIRRVKSHLEWTHEEVRSAMLSFGFLLTFSQSDNSHYFFGADTCQWKGEAYTSDEARVFLFNRLGPPAASAARQTVLNTEDLDGLTDEVASQRRFDILMNENPENWPIDVIVEEMEDYGWEHKMTASNHHTFVHVDLSTATKTKMTLQQARKYLSDQLEEIRNNIIEDQWDREEIPVSHLEEVKIKLEEAQEPDLTGFIPDHGDVALDPEIIDAEFQQFNELERVAEFEKAKQAAAATGV